MKTNKEVWFGIGLVLVLVIVWFFTRNITTTQNIFSWQQTSPSMVSSAGTETGTTYASGTSTTPFAADCNLAVVYPKPNASVAFPLTIQGIISEPNVGTCNWVENAGRAGSVIVSYDNGTGWRTPGLAVPLIVNDTLNSTSTLTFTAALALDTAAMGLKSGTPIKFTFTELNLTNNPNPNQFDMVTYLK